MLHCDRFRWILLPLLTGALLATGHPAKADLVIYDSNLSVGAGSIGHIPRDRNTVLVYDSYGRPTRIFTNRIENSTLINPVVIGVPIENSVLINPVIVSPSRQTVVIQRGNTLGRHDFRSGDRRPLPYLGAPHNGNLACTAFVNLRPACW